MIFTFEEGGTILIIPPGGRPQRIPWQQRAVDSLQEIQEPLLPAGLVLSVIQEQLTFGADDATNNGSILSFEQCLGRLRAEGTSFQQVMTEIDGIIDEIPSEANTLGHRPRALRSIRNKLAGIVEDTWTAPSRKAS